MKHSDIQSENQQRNKTEQEQKQINIGLRGGENVKEKEEELGNLGQGAQQIGETGGQQGRDFRVEQEMKSEEVKKEGRKGGGDVYD